MLISYLGFTEKYTNVIEHEKFNTSILDSNNTITNNKYKHIIFI